MSRPPLARLAAHCDWSVRPVHRWMVVGRVDAAGRAVVDAPEPVGGPSTLLDRLRHRAGGAPVLLGLDFPIGLPRRYAERAGIGDFPAFLRALADRDQAWFEVAETAAQISPDRPFYPRVPTGSRRHHLVDGLGMDAFADLLRVCERAHPNRPAASALFWLVGAQQVGRAAISGWREILAPALAGDGAVGLWPFDGGLPGLLDANDVVIAETYPAECSRHLGVEIGPGGKRARAGRAPAGEALWSTARRLGAVLTAGATSALDDAFGDDAGADDRFDAFVGLLGTLNVLLGHRPAGPPPTIDPATVAVEGWILGQTDHGG